jgi:hypothetical protein
MDGSTKEDSTITSAFPDEREASKSASEPPSNVKSLSTPSDKLRGITNAALNFLSNASNETLGACAIGLCASTYLVLGRVGLVLIGAVGGIVLHATWEGSNGDGHDRDTTFNNTARRRKELGIEVARRVLDWKDRRNGALAEAEVADEKIEASVATKALDYSDFQPATGEALTILTDAIIRDYVKYGDPLKLFMCGC